MLRSALFLPAAILAAAIVASPLDAGLLVVEDFNYNTGGQLIDVGRTGGDGWGGAWGAGMAASTARVIVDPNANLGYAGYPLAQTGTGLAYGNYAEWREANRPLAQPVTGEVWFSFLARTLGETYGAGISFNHNYYTEGVFNIGLFGNQLRLKVDGGSLLSPGDYTVGQTHLIVGRLDVATGTDAIDLWVDPDFTGVTGPDTMPIPMLTYSGANFIAELARVGVFGVGSNDRSGEVDAFRLSTGSQAFFNVTGVPEPSGVLLLAAAGAMLCLRRRRR